MGLRLNYAFISNTDKKHCIFQNKKQEIYDRLISKAAPKITVQPNSKNKTRPSKCRSNNGVLQFYNY